MGWSARPHGGSLADVYPGPREPEAGVAHLLEGEDASEVWPVHVDRLDWNRCMGPSGPGALVSVGLSPSRAVPADAVIHLWLQYDEETYAEAVLDDYADCDGDLCAVGEVLERDPRIARARLYLPWAATPALKGECLLQVSVIAGDEVVGNQWFEVVLPGPATREGHSSLGAMACAAAAMFGPTREPSEAERTAAVQALVDLFAMDALGEGIALDLLDRAIRLRPPFEKALRRVLEEIEPQNHPEVLRFLGAIGRARGQAASHDDAFVRRFAAAMGVAEPSTLSPEESLAQAWRTLELEPGATFEQVREAWRRLAVDYHPDKVQALAIGFREYATARMQQINDAYTLLKKHLNAR